MNKLPYQEFLNEFTEGRLYGVFIDDTGSPGLATTPDHLHPERKSWVAVVVPPADISEVIREFPRAIDELSQMFGSTEFHFCDIYAGRKEWKRIEIKVRLAIFGFMAHIFQTYAFPILVQTLDPLSLRDVRERSMLPNTVGPFNLKRSNDMALLLLVVRIKRYLQARGTDGERARVFVDEGYKRNGTAIHIPTYETVFADGGLYFARSADIYPIQLADFAAFCLNRTQLILGKPVLSELDKRFLEILSPISWNYVNIERREFAADEWPKLV